jgi:hypothetical protein
VCYNLISIGRNVDLFTSNTKAVEGENVWLLRKNLLWKFVSSQKTVEIDDLVEQWKSGEPIGVIDANQKSNRSDVAWLWIVDKLLK